MSAKQKNVVLGALAVVFLAAAAYLFLRSGEPSGPSAATIKGQEVSKRLEAEAAKQPPPPPEPETPPLPRGAGRKPVGGG